MSQGAPGRLVALFEVPVDAPAAGNPVTLGAEPLAAGVRLVGGDVGDCADGQLLEPMLDGEPIEPPIGGGGGIALAPPFRIEKEGVIDLSVD